ncbi:uncharacterized protein LOC119962829 isoform X2 [Scyliorhinus canicula]|nr:uncharacterized protein LOC119962829 isoform X2 [Scyliorhinus canicula]XP_038646891.1 uncharacterized protein LOC119962829 isoform X2 [Scyliorhinus canicula]
MHIPRDVQFVVFFVLKDITHVLLTTQSSVTTSEPTSGTTFGSTSGNAVTIISIFISLLLVFGIAGLLIWYFVCVRSKGFTFPRMLKMSRENSPNLDVTQQGVQPQYTCNLHPTLEMQLSTGNTSPMYQVSNLQDPTHPYENVMIGPANEIEENMMKYVHISDEDQQPVDSNEAVYENNPSMNESAVYCNYTGHPNDEHDDIYIIPSE